MTKIKPFTITSGKYEGWKCYGPYYRNKHGHFIEFYQLVKGKEKIQVYSDDLKVDLPSVHQNTKPFIDWITWDEDKVSS